MRSIRQPKSWVLLAAVFTTLNLVIYALLVGPRRFLWCAGAVLRFLTRGYRQAQKVPLPAFKAGHRFQLLVNGDQTLPALTELIAGARQSIRWQVMLFTPDHAGRTLAGALARAARRGVEVQLSFNIDQTVNGTLADFYSPALKRQRSQRMQAMLEELRQAGVEVLNNPAGVNFPMQETPARARAVQEDIARHVCIPANHYDHRKLLVVDGQRAWMGGMNVAEHYLYRIPLDVRQDMQVEARERHRAGQPEDWTKWFDTSILLEGPLVTDLAAEFDWRWQVLGGRPLPPPTPESESTAPGVQAVLLRQRPGCREVEANFYRLVRAARREIYVASPFVSYGPALAALQAAARRGVRVVIIYPNAHQEMPVSRSVFRQKVGGLVEAGVELYYNDLRMAHTKLLVVDARQVLLGSFNLNHRSFRHDLEIALLVAGEDFARQVIEQVFRPYMSISQHVFPRSTSWNPLLWLVEPFT